MYPVDEKQVLITEDEGNIFEVWLMPCYSESMGVCLRRGPTRSSR